MGNSGCWVVCDLFCARLLVTIAVRHAHHRPEMGCPWSKNTEPGPALDTAVSAVDGSAGTRAPSIRKPESSSILCPPRECSLGINVDDLPIRSFLYCLCTFPATDDPRAATEAAPDSKTVVPLPSAPAGSVAQVGKKIGSLHTPVASQMRFHLERTSPSAFILSKVGLKFALKAPLVSSTNHSRSRLPPVAFLTRCQQSTRYSSSTVLQR